MTRAQVPVTVTILEKEYRVACPESEKEALVASAHYLNTKMKEIRDTGKVIGIERISVMAALNITHELLQNKSRKEGYTYGISGKVRALQEKIENALGKARQIEL